MSKSALVITDEKGNKRYSRNSNKRLTPASTIKILTSLMAIERWGLDHRFTTEFYQTRDGTLWVKGYGDPYITSEELESVAINIKPLLPRPVTEIAMDTSIFADSLYVDGRTDTDNPYDAPPSALGVNFNTVYLKHIKGVIESGEDQTPTTDTTLRIGATLPQGIHRVNVKTRENAELYFMEVFAEKLKEQGISVSSDYIEKSILPRRAKLVYRHENSRTLAEVVKALLAYSNNYIANQLFFLLAADQSIEPVTTKMAQDYTALYIRNNFSWSNVIVADGAGLSRNNQINVNQLLELVNRFQPHQNLLRCKRKDICAKTGSLKGVKTLAGFVLSGTEWHPFAIMIENPTIPYDLHFNVMKGFK